MYPPLCGSGWTLRILVLPRCVPIPQAAHAGPEGLGCMCRCVGVAGPCVSSFLVLPRGVRIPQAAEAKPEGLGCIRRCVGVAGPYAYLVIPRGVPIHQAAPEGLGCIRRCVGVAGSCVCSFSHGAPLSPKRPRQDRGNSGVSAAMWEWLMLWACVWACVGILGHVCHVCHAPRVGLRCRQVGPRVGLLHRLCQSCAGLCGACMRPGCVLCMACVGLFRASQVGGHGTVHP